MFVVNTPPAEYSQPWAATVGERVASLIKGERRVAYVYEKPDESTFRYRVYNMIQCLQASPNQISATYFSFDELDLLINIIDQIDIMVVCRCRYNEKLNRAIVTARLKGKSVFFDI